MQALSEAASRPAASPGAQEQHRNSTGTAQEQHRNRTGAAQGGADTPEGWGGRRAVILVKKPCFLTKYSVCYTGRKHTHTKVEL